VILAGGRGSRLSEVTKLTPKPMIYLDHEPIIMHIMQFYKSQGFEEFLILCGYKKEVIYEYFANLQQYKIRLNIDSRLENNIENFDFDVTLLDTGLEASTAERIFIARKYLKSEFMLTYGDGLSNINLSKLLKFHKSNKRIATVSAVRPPARFGALKIKKNAVTEFKEKYNTFNSWINGGFFVLNESVFNYFNNLKLSFEDSVLTELTKAQELSAFKHLGFWKPMDTLREKEELQELLQTGNAPWKFMDQNAR
jgi:glucose-1-phosphate cytidylyltransferase